LCGLGFRGLGVASFHHVGGSRWAALSHAQRLFFVLRVRACVRASERARARVSACVCATSRSYLAHTYTHTQDRTQRQAYTAFHQLPLTAIPPPPPARARQPFAVWHPPDMRLLTGSAYYVPFWEVLLPPVFFAPSLSVCFFLFLFFASVRDGGVWALTHPHTHGFRV
jgi:hypothetical protein